MKCSIINTKKNNYLKLEFKDKLYKFSPTWLIENSKDLSIRDKQTNQLLIEAAELKLSLRIVAFNIKNNNLIISFNNNTVHNFNIKDLLTPKKYPNKKLWNRT